MGLELSLGASNASDGVWRQQDFWTQEFDAEPSKHPDVTLLICILAILAICVQSDACSS